MIEEKKVREKDFDIDGFLNVLGTVLPGRRLCLPAELRQGTGPDSKWFIVFELDSSNKVLLPVVTLTIMETFIARLRRLKVSVKDDIDRGMLESHVRQYE